VEIGITLGLNVSERVFWLILALALIWLARELVRLLCGAKKEGS